MPRQKGESISDARENLNIFGEWFWFAVDYLGVNMIEVARRTGIHKGTISNMCKSSDGPSKGSVTKIVAALEAIAQEKQIIWSFTSEVYHAAGFSTPSETQQSENSLRAMKDYSILIARRRLKQNKVCP